MTSIYYIREVKQAIISGIMITEQASGRSAIVVVRKWINSAFAPVQSSMLTSQKLCLNKNISAIRVFFNPKYKCSYHSVLFL